jgi:hypothetical protein
MPATARAPIAISYRPKSHDYLPVVVASIRRHLGDWPIALLTAEEHLPPGDWLQHFGITAITDWSHSDGANKACRLWEHQEVLSRYFDRWIWWHDDMVLLRAVDDPEATFSRPVVARVQRRRPNKVLSTWHGWLWDTLTFFRCQNVNAPNPVLHTPRLIERDALLAIPEQWNRSRLLFEPTYLLWLWHRRGIKPVVETGVRHAVFAGELPPLGELEADAAALTLAFGRKIDQESARRVLGEVYDLDFRVRATTTL